MNEIRQLRELDAERAYHGFTSMLISDVHANSLVMRIEEMARLLKEAKVLAIQGNNNMKDETFDAGMAKLDRAIEIMNDLGV